MSQQFVAIFFSQPPDPFPPVPLAIVRRIDTLGWCEIDLHWKPETMDRRAREWAKRYFPRVARAYCFAWADDPTWYEISLIKSPEIIMLD